MNHNQISHATTSDSNNNALKIFDTVKNCELNCKDFNEKLCEFIKKYLFLSLHLPPDRIDSY